MSLSSPVAVPVLAFVTTIHAAVVLVRRHRNAVARGSWLVLVPALAFAATPWLFPTPVGIAIGFAAQLAYFISCEKLMAPVGAGYIGGAATPRSAASAGENAPLAVDTPGPARTDRDFVAVPVLAVHRETDTIRTFRLARPPHFTFEPGQFLTVRLEIDGQPVVRCYSISSAPETAGYLEISVRRLGLVSSALHDLVRPGSTLHVKPPAGKFVYPSRDSRPLVLLAGGVGITPVLSMLRHAVATEPTRPVTLLYSVRMDADIAFRDELAVLAARHPQLQVVITVTEASAGPWRAGHIDEGLIRSVVPYPAGSLYYICGPAPMMDAMRALLARMGVPDEQVRTEVFQPSAAIGARSAAPAADSSLAASHGASARMTCTISNRVVPVAAGVSLLEAAEAGGVAIPSLCRAGVCGTCRTRVLSGDVRCTSDALDEDDRRNHYVLPCVSWTEGDCALEA